MYQLDNNVRMTDAACMNTDAYVVGGGFNELLLDELEFTIFLFKLSCLIRKVRR